MACKRSISWLLTAIIVLRKEEAVKVQGVEIKVHERIHGEKVIIPLIGDREGQALTFGVLSLEVVDLLYDFLNYHRVVNILSDGCEQTKGYANWTCCYEHLCLSKELVRLQTRANRILREKDGAQILSPAWWEKLGFNVPHNKIIIP